MSYNPDRDPVMHFCPRPACCLAFHPECLVTLETCIHKESNTAYDAWKFLESWPDTDEKLSVEDLTIDSPPCRKRRKGSETSISDPLKDFPEELVQAAQQPIVKGMGAGGVVGNVKAVVAARRLIYNTLREGSTLPTDWMYQVDVEAAIPLETKSFTGLLCPYCQSHI